MKSLIQTISQSKHNQSSIDQLISDDFLESSLRELPLKANSEQNIQKWISILDDNTGTRVTSTGKLKWNFSTLSQVAAAIVIGVGLAILIPELENQTIGYTTFNSSNSINKNISISEATANNIQLTDATTSITPEDLALAQIWVQESVQTQSTGIYQTANGKLYHAVEFNYLELPDNSHNQETKIQYKTEYIFIPVEETY